MRVLLKSVLRSVVRGSVAAFVLTLVVSGAGLTELAIAQSTTEGLLSRESEQDQAIESSARSAAHSATNPLSTSTGVSFGVEADSLTLQAAMELALSTNPMLQWYDGQVSVISGQRMQETPFGPLSVSFEREGIDAGAFNEQRMIAGGSLLSPLATVYARKRLATQRVATVEEKRVEQRRVAANVRHAFVDLMYANAVIDLRSIAVDLARSLAVTTSRREEAGEAARVDVLRARLELTDAEASHAEAEGVVLVSQVGVYRSVGLDKGSSAPPIQLPGELALTQVTVDSIALFGLMSEAPALVAAREMANAARFGVSESQAAQLPDVVADVFRQDFGQGYKAYGFQVGLRFRIPFLPASRGKVSEARGLLQQRVAVERAVAVQIAAEADSAWALYQTAVRNVKRLDEESIAVANELLRLTLRGYELGEVSLIAVLDARKSVLASRQRYLAALRDLYRQTIELERITGVGLSAQLGL